AFVDVRHRALPANLLPPQGGPPPARPLALRATVADRNAHARRRAEEEALRTGRTGDTPGHRTAHDERRVVGSPNAWPPAGSGAAALGCPHACSPAPAPPSRHHAGMRRLPPSPVRPRPHSRTG